MSDEGFLKRWSRRKRTEPPAVAETESAENPPSNLPPQAGEGLSVPPPRSGGGQEGVTPQAPGTSPKQDDDAIDPATLPPIESLGPDSDYTVFLKRGVPEAIRNAALRKAWMSDPFIRDFRGPAEYALDYTTAEFDLRPTDNVAKMLDRIFPPQPAADEPPPAAVASVPAPAVLPPSASAAATPMNELSLPQEKAEPARSVAPPAPASREPSALRRKHGGALPDEPIDNS